MHLMAPIMFFLLWKYSVTIIKHAVDRTSDANGQKRLMEAFHKRYINDDKIM